MILLIPALISLVLAVFWFWMLWDLADNDYISRDAKSKWFIAFMLTNVFAALWYYLVEYRPRNK